MLIIRRIVNATKCIVELYKHVGIKKTLEKCLTLDMLWVDIMGPVMSQTPRLAKGDFFFYMHTYFIYT